MEIANENESSERVEERVDLYCRLCGKFHTLEKVIRKEEMTLNDTHFCFDRMFFRCPEKQDVFETSAMVSVNTGNMWDAYYKERFPLEADRMRKRFGNLNDI